MDPKEKELEQREKALEEREKKLEKREKELGFFSQAVKEKKESWYDHIHVSVIKAGCVSGTYPGTQFFVPSHLFHRICSIEKMETPCIFGPENAQSWTERRRRAI